MRSIFLMSDCSYYFFICLMYFHFFRSNITAREGAFNNFSLASRIICVWLEMRILESYDEGSLLGT